MAITVVEKPTGINRDIGYRNRRNIPASRSRSCPRSASSGWRSLVSTAIANMPARILVNEANGSYNVRDNSMATVWADDLTKGGGSELIHDLTRLFELEEHVEFRRTFDSEARRMAYSMDVPLTGAFSMCNKEQGKRARPVIVSLSLGKGSLGKVYELQIAPMNFGISM